MYKCNTVLYFNISIVIDDDSANDNNDEPMSSHEAMSLQDSDVDRDG